MFCLNSWRKWKPLVGSCSCHCTLCILSQDFQSWDVKAMQRNMPGMLLSGTGGIKGPPVALWAVTYSSYGWKATGQGSVPSRRKPPAGWGPSYEGSISILIPDNNRETGQGHQSPLRGQCFLSHRPSLSCSPRDLKGTLSHTSFSSQSLKAPCSGKMAPSCPLAPPCNVGPPWQGQLPLTRGKLA